MTSRTTMMIMMTTMRSSSLEVTNPLLKSWSSQPFHLPPFSAITPNDFPSAVQHGMKEHIDDLQSIVENSDPPSFENVFGAFDRAGSTLSRIRSVFSNMCSSMNTDKMKEIQRELIPVLSRHGSNTYTFPGLFDKVDFVYKKRDSLRDDLSPEQLRLIERVHMDFRSAGAHFTAEKQEEYAEIKAQLASLCTQFSQNVMKDEETYELVVRGDDLSGCPDSLIEAARQAAQDRGKTNDECVITLSRSLVEPFLTFSDRRDLRETAWRAWTRRGEMNPERDNLKIAMDILRLRQRIAQLHGYNTFAEYQCVDRMAKTPQNVMKLLENVWGRAKESAKREREALEDYIRDVDEEELDGGIQQWDWRYYAEKVRKKKYDFDESLLKPYLSLDCVTKAVIAVSNQLFGLEYVKRSDLESYHPDVDTYEVRDAKTGKLQAIFLHDNFARPHKGGGAWMSEYRSQSRNLADGLDPVEAIPIVSNNNNFAKGRTTLLSFDEAKTLFHEMGHGHHGMLSDVTYNRLASTNVLADFVELPSQLMERWFDEPEVLKKHARHYETGEPIPDELLEKLRAGRLFNQGFATIEYTACALLDMALHQVEDYTDAFNITEFERAELDRLGMPMGIEMRHRPAHFLHLFAGTSYAAGYYVYLWAEVLDADAFAQFEETGNIFDRETAEKARRYIYSAGNTEPPDVLFRKFRGRDPEVHFMLKKKGLLDTVNTCGK